MTINFHPNVILVQIDHLSAWYSEDLGVDYRKIALNYVTILLKNPELRLDSWKIIFYRTSDPLFIEFLENLKNKIWTKHLYLNVDCSGYTHIFLACTKPKFHEDLTIVEGEIDDIVQLDQFKLLNYIAFEPLFSGPIDPFLGFSYFSFFVPKVTEEHLITLKERLSKSQNFKSGHIEHRDPFRLELIEKVFSLDGPEVSNDDEDFPYNEYYYKITKSGKTFKIIHFQGRLSISVNCS
ncbi:unnamed protein product [Caenorhabditis nigoni]